MSVTPTLHRQRREDVRNPNTAQAESGRSLELMGQQHNQTDMPLVQREPSTGNELESDTGQHLMSASDLHTHLACACELTNIHAHTYVNMCVHTKTSELQRE